jgi:Family of unknown function (DUF6261)
MIQAIDLTKLRNAEYLQFTTDVLRIVDINNPTTLQVQAKYDALNVFKNDLETLFKKSTANPITAEIETLDKRRDNAVSGILAVINGNSYHFDNAIANQAKTLLDYLKIYSGNIANENYNAETATINNMVSDFETKPELTAAMTALNLTGWKNELKAANTDFSTQYIARTIDLATASPDNLKTKRLEANAAFYDLRNHIDAFATISPSALYTKTINEINVLITQYNALLVGRTVVPSMPV